MKKVASVFLSITLLLAFVGCRNANDSASSALEGEVNSQSTITQSEAPTKEWTEQEVIPLFLSRKENANWQVIDCVLTPDFAFDRIGVILFVDDEEKTTNLAFIDSEGYYSLCGTYAQLYSVHEFSYCGNGVVTFMVQTEDGVPYKCKVSYSISNDGREVSFILEGNP